MPKPNVQLSPCDDLFNKSVTIDDEIGVKRNKPVSIWNTGSHRTKVHTVAQGFGEQ